MNIYPCKVFVDSPGLDITYYRNFYNHAESIELLNIFAHPKHTNWRQDFIKIYGKEVPIPRLQAWYGDRAYTYSGIQMHPNAWTPELLAVKEDIEKTTKTKYNAVLLNLYVNGESSVGWHSDDEPELGNQPVIASLSLGAERKFSFRSKLDHSQVNHIDLNNGSVILMAGMTQALYQHQLPKTTRKLGVRVNLTFRYLY